MKVLHCNTQLIACRMKLDDRYGRCPTEHLCEVYGLVWTDACKVVYVGSTENACVRESQYLVFAIQPGRNSRVNTALSQTRFQPRRRHFRFVRLWKGQCDGGEQLAIEQHFQNKYDTRVIKRPPNDHDLKNGGAPLQLNVNRASSDIYLISRVDAFVAPLLTESVDIQTFITRQRRLQLDRLHISRKNINNMYKRKKRALDEELEAKKRKIAFDFNIDILQAKRAWFIKQNKMQVAKHYEELIYMELLRTNKQDIAFKQQLLTLQAKFAWATEQKKIQLTAHIEQLIGQV